MKTNTKSSITLPPKELALVADLKEKLGIPTNVGVIRKSLQLLQQQVDRDALRLAYAEASRRTRASTRRELSQLDHLSAENID